MTKRLSAILLTCASAAHAQWIYNADFESGVFSPWTVAPTAAGTSIVTSIAMYAIDGPAPAAISRTASFMVGRNAQVATAEGVTLSQLVGFNGVFDVRISFSWSVHALVNVYNASGGIFELLVDGQVVAQATAPVTVAGQHSYGRVAATVHPTQGGHTVAVRITRNVPAGEEVFQYVDNFYAAAACYANCDLSPVQPALNANDFQCFLNLFAQQHPYANCDGSTNVPLLTANDFQCFLNAFAAGCT